MPNLECLNKYKNVHMIGIGGVSMSGIAAILENWGVTVTGYDDVRSAATSKLQELGIKVSIKNVDVEAIRNADAVVYTAAIKPTHPEMIEAKAQGKELIERADFLGEITKCYKNTICISGTHGKTTTTSMVSECFIEGEKDPSIQVGAFLKSINGNYRIGESEDFIIEACEYVESFLKFSPKAEIILNIDNDHLDYFKNIENIEKAFIKYVKLLPDDGVLVYNADDERCIKLPEYTNATKISCGMNNKNVDFYADNVTFDDKGFPEFDVYCHGEFYEHIKLSVPGAHNVLNALTCIAISDHNGISKENIKNALLKFEGANRRFEYKGEVNGAQVFDDYAHHPTEILATEKALENKEYRESWVIFQPHTYSRTMSLLTDFAKALKNFDNIILLDIYAAREKNTEGITSELLVNKLDSFGKKSIYIPDFNECASYVKEHVHENDIVITLGAGTVTQIGTMLVGQ